MKPYKCPVCEGTGNVEKGFYADEPERTKCRACIQGVVYGPERPEPAYVPVPYPVPRPYPVYPHYWWSGPITYGTGTVGSATLSVTASSGGDAPA